MALNYSHYFGLLIYTLQVVQAKVPDLHALEDISQYVAGGMGGGVSDSEVEDEDSKVMLPDDYVGRGNVKSQKRLVTAQLDPFHTSTAC